MHRNRSLRRNAVGGKGEAQSKAIDPLGFGANVFSLALTKICGHEPSRYHRTAQSVKARSLGDQGSQSRLSST
jgi:hypothetical protein